MSYYLTCDTCGRRGNEEDGIEAGGPCQEPCEGIVRAITTTIRLLVELDVSGDGDEMARIVTQYLTLADNPFISDYGPEAWGGYDGPFVHRVAVFDHERLAAPPLREWRAT